jgi:3D (Asp-Asp-Asp) domain-containing protein
MKSTLMRVLAAEIAAFGMLVFPVFGQELSSQPTLLEEPPSLQSQFLISQFSALLPVLGTENIEKVASRIRVVVTAYSSTPEQTDDTPFITAAGTQVRDGIVAANFLPMGTKIKLPDLYGDRIFVVEDRMHPRKNYMVDIWFSTLGEAKEFGAKNTYIEVLEG